MYLSSRSFPLQQMMPEINCPQHLTSSWRSSVLHTSSSFQIHALS
uniref:Uncharacterized protein n=1 Tax=Arundo donax TaxID=35708 RepID=A0A0A9EJP5_ARUDO